MLAKRGKDVLVKVLADLAAHRREHLGFVTRVGEFAEGFADGRVGLS
jgi:hemerythrin